MCYNTVIAIDREVDDIDSKIVPRLPRKVKMKGAVVQKPFKVDGTYTKMVTDWFEQ